MGLSCHLSCQKIWMNLNANYLVVGFLPSFWWLSSFIAHFVLANGKIHFPARDSIFSRKSGINHDDLVLKKSQFFCASIHSCLVVSIIWINHIYFWDIIYGMSSFPLTNSYSYFSEGLKRIGQPPVTPWQVTILQSCHGKVEHPSAGCLPKFPWLWRIRLKHSHG